MMDNYIYGLCCDCLNELEPFGGDYSENDGCPYRKEDGTCWTAPPEDGEGIGE